MSAVDGPESGPKSVPKTGTILGETAKPPFAVLPDPHSLNKSRSETCERCRGYVKILYQVDDPPLEPMADDVPSLGLDMLLAEVAGVGGPRAAGRGSPAP